MASEVLIKARITRKIKNWIINKPKDNQQFPLEDGAYTHEPPPEWFEIEKYLIVSLGEDKKAIDLAKKLRIQGKNVSVFYGKPSKALEYANSYKIKKVIFVGEKEVKEKVFRIKNMITGRSVKLVLKKS